MKDNHLEISGKTCCPTCGQTLPKPEPSVEILEELFDYNPLTGFVTNKYRPIKYFNTKNSYSNFNSNKVGKRTGSINKARDFRQIKLFGKNYIEHRLIWALYYKKWPPKEMYIDHINGNYLDNTIDNLRLVTPRQNSMNKRLSSSNKTGVHGVGKNSTRYNKQWSAYITVKGKQYNLGSFYNFDDAVKARKKAEKKYGFHENHGRDGVVDG